MHETKFSKKWIMLFFKLFGKSIERFATVAKKWTKLFQSNNHFFALKINQKNSMNWHLYAWIVVPYKQTHFCLFLMKIFLLIFETKFFLFNVITKLSIDTVRQQWPLVKCRRMKNWSWKIILEKSEQLTDPPRTMASSWSILKHLFHNFCELIDARWKENFLFQVWKVFLAFAKWFSNI